MNLVYGNCKTDNLDIQFFCIAEQGIFEIIGTYEWSSSYCDFWCIWNKFFSSKVVTKRKVVIHQLTKELFSREASVDKCIKCSRNFCKILWKTWLTESLPVNLLELQPNALFKKGLLSQIILKVAVRKFSLTYGCLFETFHKFSVNHPWWSVFVS